VVVPPIFSCGPGEAADADVGYVGGAWGKVNLYVGKTAVKFNIPEAEARSGLPTRIARTESVSLCERMKS
jgi:4-hydroxy-3-methylbut-2-en-1-yl diphosphate synthase IspG/GcpE